MTNEVIQLKDDLDGANQRLKENESISLKAAKLAQENADLKSKLDEASTEKKILDEKVKLMENLVSERNNTDDVAVLRSELQNVQKIMVEDIGEKKEKQLDDLRYEFLES